AQALISRSSSCRRAIGSAYSPSRATARPRILPMASYSMPAWASPRPSSMSPRPSSAMCRAWRQACRSRSMPARHRQRSGAGRDLQPFLAPAGSALRLAGRQFLPEPLGPRPACTGGLRRKSGELSMAPAYDAAVLGLGAMGAAAAYQLAKRGAKVLGIDQYAPPHEFGSTHGDTRITRIACGEGPEDSAFAARSHEIWRELEAKTGMELLTQNGFLAISGDGPRSANHGVAKFLDATVAAAKAARVNYELLDSTALRRRYPALNVADGDAAYHDWVSGFVRPERCVQA